MIFILQLALSYAVYERRDNNSTVSVGYRPEAGTAVPMTHVSRPAVSAMSPS